MNIIEIPFFAASLFSFGVDSKRSVPKNLDLFAKSFDENVIRRLKALNAASNPPSISLSWLSSAVDILSSTHADAQNLISSLKLSSSLEDSLGCYLDDSVKLLDVCNSMSSEIERLRQRRLLINFVLHLLKSPGDGSLIPAPEKLRRASDSLSDWGNCSRGFAKRSLQIDADALIRDLAARHANAPRGKITTVEKLVRRTIYAVGLVTVFVVGAVTSALHGNPELVRVRVPTEFVWADSFNGLESAIADALRRRFGGVEKKGKLEEMDVLETRVRRVCEVLNDAGRVDEIKLCVGEVETAKETFSEGLDRLSDGVNKLFDTVMCTRDGMLENFRVGHESSKREAKMKVCH